MLRSFVKIARQLSMFNPAIEEHRMSFAKFLESSSWADQGGCPFVLHPFYDNVPAMCSDMTTRHLLQVPQIVEI